MNLNRLIRRTKIALRFIFPTVSEFFYARKIRKSGLFDRQFYLSTNPNMHWIFQLFPERHYAQIGERLGYNPNPDFSPNAYMRHNPDLDLLDPKPFLHYLKFGRYENRLTKDIPQLLSDESAPIPQLHIKPDQMAPNAIVVHIYYHDLWDEFAKSILELEIEFDLYITITYQGKKSEQLKARIESEFKSARIIFVRNHGRDIAPFILLVNAGWLDGYEAICKIHTKKSPHRVDGEDWRRHLVSSILSIPDLSKKLERFKADPEAAFWVADGQYYSGSEWWGSNYESTTALLRRVEIKCEKHDLAFPAGSIYWLKPLMLDMIHGFELTEAQFEPELGQTDGTLAHAFERALGALVEAAGQKVFQTSELSKPLKKQELVRPAYVSAFYLPQFHPVPENDAWWGKGYTEWSGVTQAQPQFSGHRQPFLPTDLGYYDLRLPETMAAQADLARDVGIDAFCVYHYWFDGRRILETPIDNLLNRPEVEFPFYLCWANESWRRNWDGLSGEILLGQSYAKGFEEKLASDLAPYFQDPRYQRPDGERPRFVIYRPDDMPDPKQNVARLRAAWKKLDIGDVEMGAVRFHVPGEHPVDEEVFDFWIEMPPHGLVDSDNYLFGGPSGNRMPVEVSPDFQGLIYDYRKLSEISIDSDYLRALPKNTIAGIMPSWDNTARRGSNAHIAWGANPATFSRWLRLLKNSRLKESYRREFIINAWNEWAEKAVIEPSLQYKKGYLNSLKRNKL